MKNSFSFSEMPYRILYPYSLLTKDYDILENEVDLAVDTWRGTPHPYEEHGFNGGYPYWACFPLDKTSATYKSWRGEDGMGPSGKVFTMCNLEFRAETTNEINHYVGRRAYHIELCKDFLKKWRKITYKQTHICINGYGGESEPAKTMVEIKKEKIWTWDRIKTIKGCMSYFDGHCDLKYWKKEKTTGFLSK